MPDFLFLPNGSRLVGPVYYCQSGESIVATTISWLSVLETRT